MTPLISAPGRELLTRVNELPNKERDERESRDRNRPDSQNRPYNRCDNQKHGGWICAGRGVPNFPIVVIVGHWIATAWEILTTGPFLYLWARSPMAISPPSRTCTRAAPARRHKRACFCRCSRPLSKRKRSRASPKWKIMKGTIRSYSEGRTS